MSNPFQKVKLFAPRYSTFDLSYDYKLSFKMGYLIPCHTQECVPGDTFRMSSQAMFRMMPMVAPIMHKVDVFMHFFFVPNRIVWPSWEKFITGGEDPNVGIPAFPIMNWTDASTPSVAPSSLGDYLGLPTGVDFDSSSADTPISALPFAAYYKIWHDFYRDQNLIPEDEIELVNGPQTGAVTDKLLTLRKRAWEHDYFTACLPWAQKGDAVTIPVDLIGSGPNGMFPIEYSNQAQNSQYVTDVQGTQVPNVANLGSNPSAELSDGPGGDPLNIDLNNTHWADLTGGQSSTTLNDLRTAEALQRWYEKNARSGTRYNESIYAHFGVRSPDARLQRPEYLGGSFANMAISEVLQTSESATTAQGTMAGHGISVSGGKAFRYFCQEHGYIIGMLSVRPKTAYFQGIPRHFSKTVDNTQYYWPDFAHLGEQAVLNKEIYVEPLNTGDYNNGTFGYIPRYSEYRYNASRVGGQMRTSLDFWHMARKFATPPSLNQLFVEADPTKRVFAVTDPAEDEIVAHLFHSINAKRPLPYYAVPALV